MLEHDLRGYQCPQQFIQFKLGLKKSAVHNCKIIFRFSINQSCSDMEKFLQKNNFLYRLDKQQGLLIVEPSGV